MRLKIKNMLLVLAMLVAGFNNLNAQVVTLIDPTGDGGFENGSTFAANGWTVAAGVATNQWFVGNVAPPLSGGNCAYISQTGNGSSWSYDFTSASTVYFYRDITFPVGKPRISLTINWRVGGEAFVDRPFICYTDPANTPLVNDYMSSTPPQYATSITGNYNSWSNTLGVWSNTTTYLLPASFAGTTKRIIFGWQNDGQNGASPPAAFDNISLTAGPSITCSPTANGGLWSDAASWTSGLYPGTGDDVLISDGTSITLDVAQVVNNVTVGQGTSGTLNFTTAFNALTMSGNLTVNNGGQFNGFTQSASPTGGGITLNIAGNINLNAGAQMTLAHASSVLNMNGTSAQSINGPGGFLENQVRVLTIANPTTVTLNVPIIATEGFRHYTGTLNTNGNLTLNNTAQSYNNAYNQQVSSVIVTNMGVAYPSQPTVTIAGPSGAGTQATAIANWDATTQKVRSVTITNPGSGYRANPAVSFSVVGATTNAVATAVVLQSIQGNSAFTTIKNGGTTINGGITTINNSQGVGGISITNTIANNIGYVSAPTVGFGLPVRTFLCPTQGSGYTTATVTFTYPSGTVTTAATATALVVNGKVTSIAITAGGVYVGGNGTVNVTINGANTTPASGPTLNIPVATAVLSNGMVSGFNITNAGSDYTAAPTVTLAGGTPTAAAAAPSCRIGLYNLQYSISNAPVGVAAPVGYTIANIAATESVEIPANRKLNTLTLTNPKHLTLNDNLELTAASSAIATTNGIINFSGANKTITCSNPAYGGALSASSTTLPGFVNGIVTLTAPGGSVSRTFPVGRGIGIATGTGSGAFGIAGGCDITSISAQTDVAATGSFTTGSFSFTGFRTYNVIKNGTQYGTGPIATVQWNVEDNLASDNASIHVAQATSTSGPWTVKSISGTAGILPIVGNKVTATIAPGPIVYNANDFFSFATSFTPPPALNYLITRTTGNTYNSIAATGSSIPSWANSASTETQRSIATLLTGTTFQYQGAAVTGFVLGIDGYFTFNIAHTSNLGTIQLAASQFSPITSALAAFWGNLNCTSNVLDNTATTRDAHIKYKIDGTLGSGSAIITVEWIHMTGSHNPEQNAGSDLNFQIKLFESDNHIEYNYGLMQGFDGTSQVPWSYTTGMNGSYVQAFPAPGQVLALQEHDENTTNFTNEKAHVANAGTNILHTLPECYSSYIFTPGVQVPYVPGSSIPANDEPAGAIILTALPSPPSDYCGAKYTSYGATATLSPASCSGNADDDVWFKFAATDPETAVKVVSSGGYDAAIQVFDASLNLLSPTVCKDTSNDGRVEIAKISGLTLTSNYYVRVYHKLGGTQATAVATVANGNIASVTVTNPGSGYALPSAGSNGTPRVRVSGGGGNNGVVLAQLTGTNVAPGGITGFTLSSLGTGYTSAPTITIDPPSAGLTGDFSIAIYSNSPPPANDIICGAIPLTVSVATCNPTSGTTIGATASGGVPTCTGVADDDVFYSFVAPAGTNSLTVLVQGSATFDGVMQILSSSDNTCNGILSSVQCVNGTSNGGLETYTTTLTPGNTYFVRVFHAAAGAGSGTFTICVFQSGPPCPVQTGPPNASFAYVGGTTLKWNSVSGATGYDVYFSSVQADVISGAPSALVSSNQAGLTYSTGTLTNGVTYYWRVDGRNAIGASVGCTVRSIIGTTDLIIGSNATLCSGNFYDSGGPLGNYSNNEDVVSTICPGTPGTVTALTFTSYGLNLLNTDYLYIMNGNSIASPNFPGTPFNGGVGGPIGNTYTSTDASGCITVRFTSSSGTVNTGFGATIACVISCQTTPTSPANNGNACLLPTNTLTWPVNVGATGYDVYLDTNNPPTTLVSSNQVGNTYTTGALALGTYYWKVVNRAGAVVCTSPVVWNFIVQPLPDPSAGSNAVNGAICAGSSLSLSSDNNASGQSTGNTFSWSGPSAYTSGQQNPTVTTSAIPATHTGTYTVTVSNQYLCTATANVTIAVNANPLLGIVSSNGVSCVGLCDGDVTIGATEGLAPYLFIDANFNFSANGVFTDNQCEGNNQQIDVVDDNGCTSSILYSIGHISSVPPSINVPNPPITGLPLAACIGSTASISTSVVPLATQYIWDGPSGTTFSSANPYTSATPTASITFGSPNGSGYYIGVQAANGCGASLRRLQWVRGILSVPASITGVLTACPNSSGNYTTGAVTGATQYLWTITGDATVSGTGTTAIVNFGPAFTTGTLCVAAQTACYTSATKCIAISNAASVITQINGTFLACPGQTNTYSVAPVAGAASYAWTLPAGASGTSNTNSINVTFAAGFIGGNISVQVTSTCGVLSPIKSKTINSGVPPAPASITGPLTGMCGQTAIYQCPSQSGVTFAWTVPGGATINSGQGTNAISVTFGTFGTGSICVTASTTCGTSTARCITLVGRPNTPGAISAIPASWCANTTGVEFDVDVTAMTGSYTLSWLYPSPTVATYVLGGGNSTSLILDWITGSGSVNVTASNACGNQTRTSTQASSCREGEFNSIHASASSLSVYPNPTSGNVNIEFSSVTKGNATITVMDISGRTIATQNVVVVEGLNNTQLDLSNVSKGIYMLHVNGDNENAKIKIVIQ